MRGLLVVVKRFKVPCIAVCQQLARCHMLRQPCAYHVSRDWKCCLFAHITGTRSTTIVPRQEYNRKLVSLTGIAT